MFRLIGRYNVGVEVLAFDRRDESYHIGVVVSSDGDIYKIRFTDDVDHPLNHQPYHYDDLAPITALDDINIRNIGSRAIQLISPDDEFTHEEIDEFYASNEIPLRECEICGVLVRDFIKHARGHNAEYSLGRLRGYNLRSLEDSFPKRKMITAKRGWKEGPRSILKMKRAKKFCFMDEEEYPDEYKNYLKRKRSAIFAKANSGNIVRRARAAASNPHFHLIPEEELKNRTWGDEPIRPYFPDYDILGKDLANRYELISQAKDRAKFSALPSEKYKKPRSVKTVLTNIRKKRKACSVDDLEYRQPDAKRRRKCNDNVDPLNKSSFDVLQTDDDDDVDAPADDVDEFDDDVDPLNKSRFF